MLHQYRECTVQSGDYVGPGCGVCGLPKSQCQALTPGCARPGREKPSVVGRWLSCPFPPPRMIQPADASSCDASPDSAAELTAAQLHPLRWRNDAQKEYYARWQAYDDANRGASPPTMVRLRQQEIDELEALRLL